MNRCALFLLLSTSVAVALIAPSQQTSMRSNSMSTYTSTPSFNLILHAASDEKDDAEEVVAADEQQPEAAGTGSSDRYDVSKLVGGTDDGAGFNQFDPVLKATGFLSRRFGIIGGLTIFAALAAVEGREILKGFDDATPIEGSGQTITTPSGLTITELLIGKGGSTPLPGYIIGLKTIVSVGDKVIYDTAGDKPVAFKLGQRPFQSVICEGVEEGIKGMKVGGKRVLQVPKALAPPGVDLPPGVPLTYTVELTEVLSGYF